MGDHHDAPLTVTFNANASVSDPAQWATWRWTFGDGTFSSVTNPNHTYAAAGLYTVSLTATNLGGSNAVTQTGYINGRLQRRARSESFGITTRGYSMHPVTGRMEPETFRMSSGKPVTCT